MNNIDGSVCSNKWKYLDHLQEIRYRKVSTLTLQQVKEPNLSFWEFNKIVERESIQVAKQSESAHDVVVAVNAEETIDFEPEIIEEAVGQEIPILEFPVEEVTTVETIIERTLTVEERAKEISTVIRNNYGRYDNVPVKVKAELFQFLIDDLDADMKLHSLVLKELNEKMYSAELYDDYMSIVDVTEKKQPDELHRVDYYSNEKRWNRSR